MSGIQFIQSIKINVSDYLADCDLLVTVQQKKTSMGRMTALVRSTRRLDCCADISCL